MVLSWTFFAQDGDHDNRVPGGRCIAEAGLWMQWMYAGNLRAVKQSLLLMMAIDEFTATATIYPMIEQLGIVYGTRFAQAARKEPESMSDLFDFKDVERITAEYLEQQLDKMRRSESFGVQRQSIANRVSGITGSRRSERSLDAQDQKTSIGNRVSEIMSGKSRATRSSHKEP